MKKQSPLRKLAAAGQPSNKTSASRAAKNARAARKSAAGVKRRASKPVVIDMHGHMVMPDILAATYRHSLRAQSAQAARTDAAAESLPEAVVRLMSDMAVRIERMDKAGIDIQVVSPSILHQCTYMLDQEEALLIDRKSNDRIAETVSRHPGRLVGIGSVPLQNVAMAVAELKRATLELGLKGAIIASNVNGTELGDPSLRPFWAEAAELGAVIFIHPAGTADPRMRRHRMLISLGQPLEESFAISSLVYDGVMDEFPKLKIAIAHGGGFLPYYAGRYDWIHRSGYSKQLKSEFSGYLRSFYYDTVIFNPDMLEFLAAKVPPRHIMMGTDYPFGENKPVEFVRRARALSRSVQDGILGGNAARILGISI